MGTERGFDRLIFFTDALTAIAITLLILPLVDLVPQLKSAASLFNRHNLPQLGAFALSFVVIARLWIANHANLEHVERATPLLMWLNLAWAFTVVALPLPTALTASLPPGPLTVGIYVGTMTANSILLTAICWYIYRHPELESGEGKTARVNHLYGALTTSIAFVVALIIGTTIPGVTYWALLALLPTGAIDAYLIRRRARRAAREVPSA